MVLDSTAPLDRRAKRRDVRSEAILDAAMALLEAGGLEAVTLARVADALGYVTTAIYRYFPSKDALLAALQRRAIADIQAAFEARRAALVAGAPDASKATLALAGVLQAAESYLDLPVEQPRAWLLVAILVGDPRPLLSDEEAGRTAPLFAAFLAAMGSRFRDAAAEGALDEGPEKPRVLAFWAALHGAACLDKMRRVAPALPAAREVGGFAARSLLLSWGATPARLTAASQLVVRLGA